MPQGRSPISDLARMYGERIPTAPKSIGRLGPVSLGRGGLSMNPMPALRSVARFFRDQPGTQVSTPINMGGGTVAMGGQGGASQLVFDPAARAVERAVGDITAIPGVGKPSPSYTAEQIRQQGVVPGVLGAALDYSMFVPAVGAGVRAGRNAMRGATADAAERLAQSMASREMGMPTSVAPDSPAAISDVVIYDPTARPRIPAQAEGYRPGASLNPDGSLSLVDETGVSRLQPTPPTRPSTPAQPSRTMADIERDLMQAQTSTPADIERKLERAFQTGRRDVAARNPTQRNVDWTTTSPANEADLTKVFNTETDLMFADPLTAEKWKAQQAFIGEVVPFLENRGLSQQFMGDLYFPGRTGPSDIANLVAAEDIRGMMARVPELQQLYVDVMKFYGF